MSFSTNSIICLISGSVSTDWFPLFIMGVTSCFSACLAIFYWMTDIVNFTSLSTGDFCRPMDICKRRLGHIKLLVNSLTLLCERHVLFSPALWCFPMTGVAPRTHALVRCRWKTWGRLGKAPGFSLCTALSSLRWVKRVFTVHLTNT